MSETLEATLKELHGLFNQDQAALIARCEDLLRESPTNGPALMMLGLAAYFSQDEGLAINFFEQAHNANPDCKEYVDLLSTVLPRAGRLNDSLYYAKLSLALKPNPVLARYLPAELVSYRQALDEVAISHHAMHAEMSLRLGDFETALQRGDEELRINPHDVKTLVIVARALLGLGKSRAAVNSLRAAAYIESNSAQVHGWMAEALIACGQHAQAVPHMRLSLDLAPDDMALLCLAAGLTEWLDDANWSATQDIRDRLAARIRSGRGTKTPDEIPDSKLVGLIGDQFYDSATANFIFPIIRNSDNTVLYRLNQRRDSMTTAYKHGVMRLRECAEVDVFTLGRTMVGDQLNALIWLSTPSYESKYVNFQGTGAPPVVQWLTEPLVNHLPLADYVVGDSQTRDVDIATFGLERVITLEHMLSYAFPEHAGADENVTPLPRTSRGGVTFGIWGDLRRFTPQAIALWCRVLATVQGSTLLVGRQSNWDDATLQWMHEQFSDYGVGERIRLHMPDASVMASPLSFLSDTDIVLDATPVSSGADVARSLWMGVPVVTLKGSRRSSRFGASVLDAAGMPEWIAESEQEFASIALNLALSPDLGDIRSGLRERVERSELAQPQKLTQALATAILTMISSGGATER
jgi:predicted O-linked N-acetylglucosamine transferase (SPINDLY family)